MNVLSKSLKNNDIIGLTAVAGLAVLMAGCSSMGDFGRRGTPVAAASGAALQPAALVEAEAPIPPLRVDPPAVTATANIAGDSASPNLGVVPPASENRVLSPDEKARVIAELEALARSQGAATERARAELADCVDLSTLTVEERMKRVAQGLKC